MKGYIVKSEIYKTKLSLVVFTDSCATPIIINTKAAYINFVHQMHITVLNFFSCVRPKTFGRLNANARTEEQKT